MQIDVNLQSPPIADTGRLAVTAEETGFDGAWVTETTHSPYTLTTLMADKTTNIDVGTSIAVAFPRSPMVTAYTAWDIQSLAGGRFILGLGTQVKGHIQRRFDISWGSPGPQLRDYISALKHIWSAWQTGEEVDYHGEFYEIDLCPPDWRPDPIENPEVPIYVAGVNSFNVKLAGHHCDGLHIHPINSPAYINQKVLPALEKGLDIGNRSRKDVTLATSTFGITGTTAAEMEAARESVRRQIAFYGSTRTYKTIFDVHGWGSVCGDLHDLSVDGRWDEMAELITNEMLETFAVEAPWDKIYDELEARYEHIDRVSLYMPYRGEDYWECLV